MRLKLTALAATLGVACAPACAAGAGGDDPICTDRPGKGNNACTVPAGTLQLETDLINWTRDDQGGVRTDTILYTNPTLKLGLTVPIAVPSGPAEAGTGAQTPSRSGCRRRSSRSWRRAGGCGGPSRRRAV